MLNASQVELYLNRLECPADVTLDNLKKLHEQHLMKFPFGSMTRHYGGLCDHKVETFYDKIVASYHSGYCFELNYCFHQLLKALNFNVTLHQSQTYKKDPTLDKYKLRITHQFSHMINIVTLDGRQYLCDVGKKDGIRQPIEIKENSPVEFFDGTFDFRILNGVYQLIRIRKQQIQWANRIDMQPRDPSEFIHMFDYHNYSPMSHINQASYLTHNTRDGYNILIGTTYREMNIRDPNKTVVKENLSIHECLDILKKEFNIIQDSYNPVEYKYECDPNLEIVEFDFEVNI